jgi:hypothetical protein
MTSTFRRGYAELSSTSLTVKKLLIWLLSRLVTPEDIRWIVTDQADLGVELGGRKFVLYKGHSIEVHDTTWRQVNKREFGESVNPPGFSSMESGYLTGYLTGGLPLRPRDGVFDDYTGPDRCA